MRRGMEWGRLVMAAAAAGAGVGVLAGCSGAVIAARESMGYAKRDQLRDEVKTARKDQAEAKEQFATTLDEFKALTAFSGGELEKKYSELKSAYDRAADRAADVRGQIGDVERVASALFSEWERELDQYSAANQALRSQSESQLRATRASYEQLVSSMRRASDRMTPVLTALNDQVLFLKHNLNARAIASLGTTVTGIEAQVDGLIAEMNASIAEADAFIKTLETEG